MGIRPDIAVARLHSPSDAGGRGSSLQRLFSSFPDGAAGAGLLLLRVAVGAVLATQGVAALSHGIEPSWRSVLASLATIGGLALAIGVLTPVAAAVAVGPLVAPFLWPALAHDAAGGRIAEALTLAMAVAIGLVGPGAYSVDARVFGRREIQVPRRRPTQRSDGGGVERTKDDSRRS